MTPKDVLENSFENEMNHLQLLHFVPKNKARFQKCQNFKTNSERELEFFTKEGEMTSFGSDIILWTIPEKFFISSEDYPSKLLIIDR